MMRTFDKYELRAIASAQQYVNEYAIMKTVKPVPNVCKVVTRGKRQLLSIMYKRCDDPYFVELSVSECTSFMKQ